MGTLGDRPVEAVNSSPKIGIPGRLAMWRRAGGRAGDAAGPEAEFARLIQTTFQMTNAGKSPALLQGQIGISMEAAAGLHQLP
jgi:hypothetical protein